MLGPIVQKCLQNTASELNSADVGEYAKDAGNNFAARAMV